MIQIRQVTRERENEIPQRNTNIYTYCYRFTPRPLTFLVCSLTCILFFLKSDIISLPTGDSSIDFAGDGGSPCTKFG